MEKYDLAWWQLFKATIEGLAVLGAWDTFDSLTRELLGENESMDALASALQWYETAEQKGQRT